jgi:radical SAM protein with 4Fe4S-binding SPASM domain
MTNDCLLNLEFTEEEIQAAVRDGRLLSLELETSRECNLRCVYCYSDAGIARPGELSFEELSQVVDQARDLGARKIIVLGGGEPLLYDRLFDLLAYIRGRELSASVFTNGTLVTREVARRLFELKIGVVTKRNSARRELQDLLAGVSGAADLMRRGLANLREAGYPTQDAPLGIATIACRQNLEEIPALWVEARDAGITPYVEAPTPQGRAREIENLHVSPGELKELFEKLAEIDATRYGTFWEPHPPIAGMSCRRHFYSCTVDSSGFVLPCVGVDEPVGNVREKPLEEILRTSPVIQAMRGMEEHIKGACATCHLRSICYGCRGAAYQLTGDVLAADPHCWLNPENSEASPQTEAAEGARP